ncbi:MAG: SRPBCC family protein [Tannerellaceae bacterium]|jgi:hypothetical protein|nr:SRPBCC family protein [Tannerellaceae bacterium]
MTEFISETKIIPFDDDRVFKVLSDFSNFERVKDAIPEDKIKGFSFDNDSCNFFVDPVGKICLRITEREPNSTIKIVGVETLVPIILFVQLKQATKNKTTVQLILQAKMNPFIELMASKPLKEALAKVLTLLVYFPY